MKSKLSVVIIAKNEDEVIYDCLESVKWAEDIVFLDGGSTDKTLEIAKEFHLRLLSQKEKKMNYAAWHNQGKDEAKGDWILYVDADERIPPLLKEEIQQVLETGNYSVYAIPRRNLLLGKELRHGGWYPDYQLRLFRKESLKEWVGELHEHPVFTGEVGKLKNPMVHLQPDKIEPALSKSIRWSSIEADLLFQSEHPSITWWRILRMGATTLFDRLVKKQGLRDGIEGWIESIYQSFHTMIIYMKLWEMQTQKITK